MKKLLVVLGMTWAVGLLVLLYRYTENGRYQLRSGEGLAITDTRTGSTFVYRGDLSAWKELPPLEGPRTEHAR